jgi:hypothetical protein
MFVSRAKGSLHGAFQRSVERGNLFAADAAARQLGELSLPDALALTVLFAEHDPDRFERAAVRWHARFALETPGVTLAESQLVLAALAGLSGPAPPSGPRRSLSSVDVTGSGSI